MKKLKSLHLRKKLKTIGKPYQLKDADDLLKMFLVESFG